MKLCVFCESCAGEFDNFWYNRVIFNDLNHIISIFRWKIYAGNYIYGKWFTPYWISLMIQWWMRSVRVHLYSRFLGWLYPGMKILIFMFFRVRVRSCSIILEKSVFVFVHVRANGNEHQCSLYMCLCSFILVTSILVTDTEMKCVGDNHKFLVTVLTI